MVDKASAGVASNKITSRIAELADWRGKTLKRLRDVIVGAAPSLVEEWKWNTPVWSHNGPVVAAGAFKDHIKINFFKGASLSDPKGIFNAGLEAKGSRAIDLYEGDKLDEKAFRDLVRAAAALDEDGIGKKSAKKR